MRRESKKQSLLPSGYRQLEYLESTGTQYINTGVYADTDTEIDVTVAWTRIFNDNAVISMDAGSYTNNSFTLEYANSSLGITMTFDNRDGFPRSGITPIINRFYEIKASKNGLEVDGITYNFLTPYGPFSCPYPLFAFCYGRRGSSALNGEVCISCLKIGNNGNLQRNYLPALRIADSKPGLYDLVNGQFETNSGTGEFLFA